MTKAKFSAKQLAPLFYKDPAHTDFAVLEAIAPAFLEDLAAGDESVLTWHPQLPEYLVEYLHKLPKHKITVDHILTAGLLFRLINRDQRADLQVMKKVLNVIESSPFSLLQLFSATPLFDFKAGTVRVLFENIRAIINERNRLSLRLNKVYKHRERNEKARLQEKELDRKTPSPDTLAALSVVDGSIQGTAAPTEESKRSRVFYYDETALSKAERFYITAISTVRLCAERLSKDFLSMVNHVAENIEKLTPEQRAHFAYVILNFPFMLNFADDKVKMILALVISLINDHENNVKDEFLRIAVKYLTFKAEDINKNKKLDPKEQQKQEAKQQPQQEKILAWQLFLLHTLNNVGNNDTRERFCELLAVDIETNWANYPAEVKTALFDYGFVLHTAAHINKQCLAYLTRINARFVHTGRDAVTPETMNYFYGDRISYSAVSTLACTNFADPKTKLYELDRQVVHQLVKRMITMTESNGVTWDIKPKDTYENHRADKQGSSRLKIKHFEGTINSLMWSAWIHAPNPVHVRIDSFTEGLETTLAAGSIFVTLTYKNGKYTLTNPATSCEFVFGKTAKDVTECAARIAIMARKDQGSHVCVEFPIIAMKFTTYKKYTHPEQLISSRASTPNLPTQERPQPIIRSNSLNALAQVDFMAASPLMRAHPDNPYEVEELEYGLSMPPIKPNLPRALAKTPEKKPEAPTGGGTQRLVI